MNDKTKTSGAIILPDQDGVADLEIRRIKRELDVEPESREMCGYMPADLVPVVLKELEKIKKQVEEGNVSSICLIAVLPQNSIVDAGAAFISAADGELDKIHELFHLALLQRLGEEPPDDEAG